MDRFAVLTNRYGVYMSRSVDIFVDNDDNDNHRTDCLPLAHACGVIMGDFLLKNGVDIKELSS